MYYTPRSFMFKTPNCDHVLKLISQFFNKIRAQPLNHELFRTLFEDKIIESGELLLFYEVRWLTKGKALGQF